MQTYAKILEIAIAYNKNQPIEHENESFFASVDPQDVQHYKDNVALDYFGFATEQSSGESTFGVAEIQKVYEAAKIMFAQHPDKTFVFDFEGAYGQFGSPWSCECENPEQWVIAQARRLLEDDEAEINPSIENKYQQVFELCQELMSVGVPLQDIKDNLSLMCYGHDELAEKVKNLL